jgi:hypothetical protein
MECLKVGNNLHAYLDDELDEATRKEVEEHLSQCPDCANEVELLKLTSLALSEWDDIEPSGNFNSKVWEKIEQDEKLSRTSLFPRFRIISIAAALLVVVSVTAYVLMDRIAPQTPIIVQSDQTDVDVYVEEYANERSHTILAPEPAPDWIESYQSTSSYDQSQQSTNDTEIDFYLSLHTGGGSI